jgi:hypothetical protein
VGAGGGGAGAGGGGGGEGAGDDTGGGGGGGGGEAGGLAGGGEAGARGGGEDAGAGAGAGAGVSAATPIWLLTPLASGSGLSIRATPSGSVSATFGCSETERVSSHVFPTTGKTLLLPTVVSSVAAWVDDDRRWDVWSELPPKKTWRALRAPLSARERTASTGSPIVSQRMTTSGTATRIGSRRARERRDRLAPGNRFGKSMYERLIELLFRARKRVRGLSVGRRRRGVSPEQVNAFPPNG